MPDRAVPNLPSSDLARTKQFYGSFGFAVVHEADSWLILRRGSVELEFFPDGTDAAANRTMASIRVGDVDAFYAAVRAAGVPERPIGFPRLIPVVPQPWGRRVGFLVDPDGTQLHLIGEPDAGTTDAP